jgi:bifunctional lysine-specific demethylase and histidyl-hydroxylase NO66
VFRALPVLVADPEEFVANPPGRPTVWHMPVDGLRDLLSLRDIDEILPGLSRVTHGAWVIADGKRADPLTYTRPDDDRYFPGGLKSLEVSRLVDGGGTLVINRLTHHSARIREFAGRLEFELGVPVEEVCAFLTPPGCTGLGEHGDPDPVLLAQVEGSKAWTIRAPAGDGAGEADVMEVTLDPGDVLWIPKGWLHRGSTGTAFSLHMTVGLQTFTPAWLVKQVVDRLLDADPALRSRQLPYGCAVDPEKMRETTAETLADFGRRLLAADLGELAERLASAMHRHFVPSPRAAAESLALRILPDDRFVLNVESILSLRRSPDGELIARLRDSTLTIPARIGDFVEDRWKSDSAQPWTVADIAADISQDTAIRLVSGLFKAGVVRRSR